MTNFNRLGILASVVFCIGLALLLWAAFSDTVALHEQSKARIGLRLWVVTGIAFCGWYLREAHQRANPTRFTDDMPFAQHLEARAVFDDVDGVTATWLAPGKIAKAVVAVGGQGFDARLRRIDARADAAGAAGLRIAVQLLAPARALPVLAPAGSLRVFIEGGPTGTATVLSAPKSTS